MQTILGSSGAIGTELAKALANSVPIAPLEPRIVCMIRVKFIHSLHIISDSLKKSNCEKSILFLNHFLLYPIAFSL